MQMGSFYKIILIFFITLICGVGYSSNENTNTEEYCKELYDSAVKEYKANNYVKSLEHLVKVQAIAENNNFFILQIRSLNIIAVIYMKSLDYEKAMEYYMMAYRIAIRESGKEYQTESNKILNNIAYLYSLNKDYDKAKEYVAKACSGALQLQDSLYAGVFATNLAIFANRVGNLEEAEKYLDIAATMLKETDVSEQFDEKLTRINNLFLKGEYNKAEQLALSLLNQKLKVSSNAQAECLLKLSQIYQQKKSFKKAIESAKEALNTCREMPFVIEVYEHLSKLYQDVDDPYLSIQYLDSVIIAKDSYNKTVDMAKVTINQVKFDLINSEKALAESRAKQKAERILFIFILIFIIILAGILIWVFRIQSIRNKQRKQITELELIQEKNQKLILGQELKEKETASLLERERLSNEINVKNKQLTAKILSQTNNNELIKDIIKELSEIPSSKENPMLDAVIRKLKMQLSNSLEWSAFLDYFEQINPALLESLQRIHPNLSVNNMQLLSCIYLNLDTKKIAYLLNISTEACRKKKQRLANKMGIHVGELYDYVANIAKSSL